MNRSKILHVVFSLEPGGLENGIVNVTRLLDPREFEVRVCCLEKRGSFADRLPAGTQITVLEKRPGFSWRAVVKLMCVIWQYQPDVVHTHNLGPLIYAALATA